MASLRTITFSKDTENVTPKLDNCIGKVFETIKTPMSEGEGYHPELGDLSLCNN